MGLYSREAVDKVLSLVPPEARCAYTGQSILAYCPDPTFDWSEVNAWPDETDIDIFAYSKAGLASLVQLYMSHGWEPITPVDEFKANRIRYWDQDTRRFKLQTVALQHEDLPILNLTWYDGADDLLAVIKRFDMDYLMVGFDLHTRRFADLRGTDHRVANVNYLNAKFDVSEVDVMFWVRQFDRCPKGYARGIDTRPVARTYVEWLDESIERGDWSASSKTRSYADRRMEESLGYLVEDGLFTTEQAERMYHFFRREDNTTWEAMRLSYETIRKTIADWLASVEDD